MITGTKIKESGPVRVAEVRTMRSVIKPFPSIDHAEVMFEHGFVIEQASANWRRAGYVLGTAGCLGALLDDLDGAAAAMTDALGLSPARSAMSKAAPG